MNVLDLFSGIGGFSLGLERAGMRTVAFCEIEPYARAVLAKHWPSVPCYDDVRTLTADRLRADGIIPDVICGGFPCQDISKAGAGAGIDGARSGLWSEYRRLVGELRPLYVAVENVSALLGRGIDRVLGDLAALGYDAEWHCIRASDVGAPHLRDRIVANARCGQQDGRKIQQPGRTETVSPGDTVPHPHHNLHAGELAGRQNRGKAGRSKSRDKGQRETPDGQRLRVKPCPGSAVLSNTISSGLEGRAFIGRYLARQLAAIERGREVLADADSGRELQSQGGERDQRGWVGHGGWWFTEPGMGRVAHGVSSRVDRIECLGNAVVPQIPQIIGEAIMAMHRTT